MNDSPTALKVTPIPAAAEIAAPHLHKVPRHWPVVAIGVYKLAKTVALIAVGIFMRHLLSPEQHQAYVDLVEGAPHTWVNQLLVKLLAIPPETLRLLRIGIFVYAALFLIEGIGLLWDKKWAEWMVIITTAGFVPVEIYEVAEKVTAVRCAALVANIVVAGYLCFRLKRMATVKKERAGFPAA